MRVLWRLVVRLMAHMGNPFSGDYTYLMWRHDLGVLTNHKRAELRVGQVAFNSLYETRPELANAVRATPLDPFHMDERLDEFFAYVEEHWDSDVERRW